MYKEGAVKVTKGTLKVYRASDHGRRHFCAEYGTGLFYVNATILPGIIDIQGGTYDALMPSRRANILMAERIGWMARTRAAHALTLPDAAVISLDS